MSARNAAYAFGLALLALAATAAADGPNHANAGLPRYLYVATTAQHEVLRDKDDDTHVALTAPVHVQPGELRDENPLDTDFYVIDTTLLTKRIAEDQAHPGVFTHDGALPPDAVMAYATQEYGSVGNRSYRRWKTSINSTYLAHFGPGEFPRVRYTGEPTRGEYDLHGVGGPKLVLNEDAGYLNALETRPDEMTVVLHGSAGDGFWRSNAQGYQTRIREHDLAHMIHAEIARRGLPRNLAVRLIACESGQGQAGSTASSAQRLADALVDDEHPEGNVVHATTGLAWNDAHTLETETGEHEIVVFPTNVASQSGYGSEEYFDASLRRRYRTYTGRSAAVLYPWAHANATAAGHTVVVNGETYPSPWPTQAANDDAHAPAAAHTVSRHVAARAGAPQSARATRSLRARTTTRLPR